MGINDRDYMRKPELEPPAPPRTLAFRSLILAVAIVGGVIFLGRRIQENRSEQEAADIAAEMPMIIRIPEPREGPIPLALRRLVNVNTATLAELESVPEISEAIALAIIAHRPYEKLEGLKRVPGIKAKRLELLRPYLTVE